MSRKTAVVIGSGIGGLACAIRLQSMGFATTIVEKLDDAGGRAYVRRAEGFVFDMGPTVLTVPHFIEELFALQPGQPMLDAPDFPAEVLTNPRITSGISGGPHTSRYLTIVPVLPFYRIYFDDGTWFDYDGDPASVRAQIERLAPEDLDGYTRFHDAAQAIFQRGFLELGYTYFGNVGQMLRVVPDLLKLGAVQPLFSLVKKYFKSDKMRQVFSFEPLLVGGNPMNVPAIYAMIHFVEKTWGVHFAMGGTGALVTALVRKFEELGGTLQLNAEVAQINVAKSGRKRVASGVTLASGQVLTADVVVSNADYATTYLKMVDKAYRRINRDMVVKFRKHSMSIMVIYFGYAMRDGDPELRHHNIILGPRYEELLTDIFERKILADDFSQYLHIPTLTDPSLAPPGHHAAYTLIPVPNTLSDINWDAVGDAFADKVMAAAAGVTYNGNSSVTSVQIANGQSVNVNVPGDQLFLNPSGSVLGSINQLITAVQNNSGISAAVTALGQASNEFDTQRLSYGTALNELQTTGTFLTNEQLQLSTQETNIDGADIAQVATQFSQAQIAYTSLLEAETKILNQPNILSLLQ